MDFTLLSLLYRTSLISSILQNIAVYESQAPVVQITLSDPSFPCLSL